MMQPENDMSSNIMNKLKPVMTVFAGTNGAGKSTLSMQMRAWLGELVDPDQIARELKPDDPRSVDLSAGREAVKKNQIVDKKTGAFCN